LNNKAKAIRLGKWLKWDSRANARPWIQTPVLEKNSQTNIHTQKNPHRWYTENVYIELYVNFI
jgi:hypothetical protein